MTQLDLRSPAVRSMLEACAVTVADKSIEQRLLEDRLATRPKGGPGSGFFGHAGRPGRRGGSAPRIGHLRRGDPPNPWPRAMLTPLPAREQQPVTNPKPRHEMRKWAEEVEFTSTELPHPRVIDEEARRYYKEQDRKKGLPPRLIYITHNSRMAFMRHTYTNYDDLLKEMDAMGRDDETHSILQERANDLVAALFVDAKKKYGVKGGPGSGFFGHAGRPGKRGGSTPSKGHAISDRAWDKLIDELLMEFGDAESDEDTISEVEGWIAPGGRMIFCNDYQLHRDVAEHALRWLDRYGEPVREHINPERDFRKLGFVRVNAGSGEFLGELDLPLDRYAHETLKDTWAKFRPDSWAFDISRNGKDVHLTSLEPGDDRKLKAWLGLEEFEREEKGGAGSGFFGHAGRPGKRGGSAPGRGHASGRSQTHIARLGEMLPMQVIESTRPALLLVAREGVIFGYEGDGIRDHSGLAHTHTGDFKAAQALLSSSVHLRRNRGMISTHTPWAITNADDARVNQVLEIEDESARKRGMDSIAWRNLQSVAARLQRVGFSSKTQMRWGRLAGTAVIAPLSDFEKGVRVNTKGGVGSGNFGHAGRPGKRGGSAPRAGHAIEAAQLRDWRYGDEKLPPEFINATYGKIVIDTAARRVIIGRGEDVQAHEELIKGDLHGADYDRLVRLDYGKRLGIVGTYYDDEEDDDRFRALERRAKRSAYLLRHAGFPGSTAYEWDVEMGDRRFTMGGTLRDWTEHDQKGGVGSGNWGHAGRPGQRGGSAPRRGHGRYNEDFINEARKLVAHAGPGQTLPKEITEPGQEIIVLVGRNGVIATDPKGGLKNHYLLAKFYSQTDSEAEEWDNGVHLWREPDEKYLVAQSNWILSDHDRKRIRAQHDSDDASKRAIDAQAWKNLQSAAGRLQRAGFSGDTQLGWMRYQGAMVMAPLREFERGVDIRRYSLGNEDTKALKGIFARREQLALDRRVRLSMYLHTSGIMNAIKGGPGSGNFGHLGRPGKRGGSAARTGHGMPKVGTVGEYRTWGRTEIPVYRITGQESLRQSLGRGRGELHMLVRPGEIIFAKGSAGSHDAVAYAAGLRGVKYDEHVRFGGTHEGLKLELRTSQPGITVDQVNHPTREVDAIAMRNVERAIRTLVDHGADRESTLWYVQPTGGRPQTHPFSYWLDDEQDAKGGPGSGNHGHAGRPGKVGGSMPRGGHSSNGFERVYNPGSIYGEETIGRWAERHGKIINDDGTITFYHGRPKSAQFDTLRVGSLLAHRPWDAAYYAARDRNLKVGSVEVIPVRLKADDINPAGPFIETNSPIPLPADRMPRELIDWNVEKEQLNERLDAWQKQPAKKPRARKGGPGSGFHGHAGRPGKRGGSAPRAGHAKQPYEMDMMEWAGQHFDERLNGEVMAAAKHTGLRVIRDYDELPAPAPGNVRLYHGTWAQNVESIGQRGLMSARQLALAGARGRLDPEHEIEGVLFTPNPQKRNNADDRRFHGDVIFVADVPEAQVAGQRRDDGSLPNTVQLAGVPRKNLVGLYVPPLAGYVGWRELGFDSFEAEQAWVSAYSQEHRSSVAEALRQGRSVHPRNLERYADLVAQAQKGGPGSGNYGHAGRPGKVGGSMPRAGHALAAHNLPAKMQDVIFYHGTPKAENGEKILNEGLRPGTEERHGFLKPIEGRVYLTPDIEYATIYALGGDMAGHDMQWLLDRGDSPTGYVFGVKVRDLYGVIEPDEDWVGEALGDHKYPWLDRLGERHLTPNTLRKVRDGEMAWQARAGKTLLKRMSDDQKLTMILDGAHVSHEGPVKFTNAWRLDKRKSTQMKRRKYEPDDMSPERKREREDSIWAVLEPVDAGKKGGPGSGNYGHAGRPDKRGGSAPKDGHAAAKPKTHTREQWSPGDMAHFEYHCHEGHDSADAVAWYHSHQRAKVLRELEDVDGSSANWPDSTANERAAEGLPRMYRVQFRDGVEWDVFEDELMTSKAGFYRPDPPPPPQGTKGGPGSGNHGHAGRPGKVGGSAPRAGHGSTDMFLSPAEKRTLKPGQRAGEGFVFHNTNATTVEEIERVGMIAGSFSDKPIDFGGNAWLAVHRDYVPEYQEHQYSGARALEPKWEIDGYGEEHWRTERIPPAKIYLVDRRGKVIRQLGQPERWHHVKPDLQTPGATLQLGSAGSPKNFTIQTNDRAYIQGILGTDFEGEYTKPTRGELFYAEVPPNLRRLGIGRSLVEDGLRVLVANGMQTVNLHPVSKEGRALVDSLVRDGSIESPIRVSSVGKSEHRFGKHILDEVGWMWLKAEHGS